MRSIKSIKNSFAGLIIQILTVLLGFISRFIFVQYLNAEYLGYNGLFSNILSVLSIAELGIGTAITYRLYKPLRNRDFEKVSQIIVLYKYVYIIIGSVIFILGMLLMPYIHFFIKEDISNLDFLRMVYFLYLTNSVITYFFAHKRTLLFANQENTKIISVDFLARVVTTILQIIVLKYYTSYIGYLLIGIGTTIISNIVITFITNISINLKPYNIGKKLDRALIKDIYLDAKNVLIIKIAGTGVLATDNLVISTLISNIMLGFYSNYLLVINSVISLISSIVKGLTASIGDLMAEDDKTKLKDIFFALCFLIFMLASYGSISILLLIQPFIELAFGTEYLLSNNVVIVLACNFYILVIREPLWQMVNLSGRFKEYSWLAVFEAFINILLSIILANTYGLIGVFLGTLITYQFGWFSQFYISYKYVLSKKIIKPYVTKMFIYIIYTISIYNLINLITTKVVINNVIINLVLKFIIISVIFLFSFIICFSRVHEFKFIYNRVKELVLRSVIK